MADRVFLRPPVPAVLAFAAGIVAAESIGDAWPGARWAGWALALFAAGWIVLRWRTARSIRSIGSFRSLRLPALLFLLALGHLSIQPWISPRFPPDHVVHLADGEYRRIVGRVVGNPEDRFRGFRFALDAEQVDGRPASGRIWAGAGEDAPRPASGDRAVLTGRLRRIRSFRNPGGFDYERFMAFRGLFVSAWARKGSLRIAENDRPLASAHRVDRLRARISDAIRRAVPGEAGAVLRALTVGDRNAIDPELRERFARAGVAHLLAISGLHIGIVGGVAFFLLRRLLARIPALLRRGLLDRTAGSLALVPVLAYGILSGGSPSTQRAAGAAVLVLTALWVRRRPDPATVLALVAFAILAVHPPALFSIGFQLSFAAVGAILTGMSAFRNLFSGKRTWIRRFRNWGIGMGLVSAFAIWGTLPLVMRYFHQAVFVGLISNFLFIPLVGFGAVPLGLVGALLFPFFEPAGNLLFQWSGFPIFLALQTIPFFADFPFGAFRIPFTPTIPEMAAYYALGIGAILFRKADPKRPGFQRRRAAALMAACLLFLVGDAVFWMHRRFGRTTLRVTAVDVGQGTATLLEFPRGPVVLVDGGGFRHNRIFDVGKRIVAPLLRHRRIATLDAVALSHADGDHLNGLLFVLEHFRVKEFWTPDPDGEDFAMDRLREILERREIPAPPFRALPRRRVWNGTEIEILHPPIDRDFPNLSETDWRHRRNNRSLVLRVALGEVSFLLPGDIEFEAEAEMADRFGKRLRSTVLMAPHHGSRSSSSPEFVDAVAPALAVVSAGYENRFGFPAPEVVARYRDRDVRVLRTDRNGAVGMETDGRTLRIRTEVPRRGIAVDIPRGLP